MSKINKKLSLRGVSIELEQIPNLFTSPDISAGTAKIVANMLRRLGYIRADWDDIKTRIMVELLVQKFSDANLNTELCSTNPKLLIEGNDWGDTYWGICDGRGRNVLGRILMLIRKIPRHELIRYSDKLRHPR